MKTKAENKPVWISSDAMHMDAENPCPFRIDQSYFIRTVTYHLIGTVVDVVGHFLILKDASWVADSGRFMQAIRDGKLNEVEPVGDAVVNLDSITDAFPWQHPNPTGQR